MTGPNNDMFNGIFGLIDKTTNDKRTCLWRAPVYGEIDKHLIVVGSLSDNNVAAMYFRTSGPLLSILRELDQSPKT